MMNPLRAVCVLTALPLMLAPALARVPPRPFSITVLAPHREFKAGAEVKVQIVLENTSGKEISLSRVVGDERAEFDYAIEVRDSSGRRAPETRYGRSVRTRTPAPDVPQFFSVIVFPLQPAETWTDVAVITKLYDLSRPGKYTIQAEREIPRELGQRTVKSGPITITITE